MPRRLALSPGLAGLLDAQEQVISRGQALESGFTRRAIDHQLSTRQWQLVLPDVYLTHRGRVTRRQRLHAALLYVGINASALDGLTACHDIYDLDALPRDERVYVVTHGEATARSRDFVVVRRAVRPPTFFENNGLTVVGVATAVVAACRRIHDDRATLASFSEVLQRRKATYDALCLAHVAGPPRNAKPADRALLALAAGVRSLPEADFRRLAEASPDMPSLVYNCLLRLPSGRLVSPDALDPDSGVVHETNGRRPHAREDLFEDMQERHDAMTAVGLTVLHNSPRRLQTHPRLVIDEFLQCSRRLAGRGLPPGVELVRIAA